MASTTPRTASANGMAPATSGTASAATHGSTIATAALAAHRRGRLLTARMTTISDPFGFWATSHPLKSATSSARTLPAAFEGRLFAGSRSAFHAGFPSTGSFQGRVTTTEFVPGSPFGPLRLKGLPG